MAHGARRKKPPTLSLGPKYEALRAAQRERARTIPKPPKGAKKRIATIRDAKAEAREALRYLIPARVTVAEAAEILCVSKPTVRRLVAAGELRSQLPTSPLGAGEVVLIHAESLVDFVDRTSYGRTG